MERHDVIIIGGGQAGLAMGYQLARRGMRFLILDAASSAGHSWRSRWDSLRLFTPARYSALPGMAFPGDPDGFASKDEVASYLAAYVAAFGLPVRFGERVVEVAASVCGGYRVGTERGSYLADQVVIATGPFQKGRVPGLATRLASGVIQLHSGEYRNPEQLPEGEILVVGGGNSGMQIAEELAGSRPTTLAVGERLPRLPERLLGRSIFWWLERTGAISLSGESWLGRRARDRETLIGTGPGRVAAAGVRLVDRVVSAEGTSLRTARGAELRPAAVVWATGYRGDYAWLRVPVLSAAGAPVHAGGVTAARGLYFLGLPWQRNRGSALLGWVGRDAAALLEPIVQQRVRRLRFTLSSPGRSRAARTAPESPTARRA